MWINQGDIILLSLRDYQDGKGDVILKYSADEARSLKAYGELPESAKINETDTYGHEGVDDNVEFDEDREEEDQDQDEDSEFEEDEGEEELMNTRACRSLKRADSDRESVERL